MEEELTEQLTPSVPKTTTKPPAPTILTITPSSSKGDVYDWAKKIVDEKNANILLDQEVDGDVLLHLTEERLLARMSLGPANKLSRAIEELKRAQKPGIDPQSSINNAPKIMYIISYHYYHHYRTYY